MGERVDKRVGVRAAVGDIVFIHFADDRYVVAGFVTDVYPNGRVRWFQQQRGETFVGAADTRSICLLQPSDVVDFARAAAALRKRRSWRFQSASTARRFFAPFLKLEAKP